MRTKSTGFYFKATPEELDQIREKMEEAGMENMSAYILRMALYGYVIKPDLSDLKEILRLTHINSNNINQYARRANEGGSIYLRDIEDVQRSHKEIIRLLGILLDRLSFLQRV